MPRPRVSTLTLLDCLPRFSSYMETSTRLSPRTRVIYGKEVERFIKAVKSPEVANLTPGLLLAWHSAMHKAGLAPATIEQRKAAVSRFLRYLIRFEIPRESVETAREALDSLEDLHVPKESAPKRPPYALTREQVEKMLAAAERLNPGVGLRNRTMIHFLWGAGVRRAELVDIEMEGLNLEGRSAIITGKGSKTREVVFDQGTVDQLRRWLADRETWPIRCGKVFISANGNRIDPNLVNTMVKQAAQAAGLRKDVWPHLLRHTLATTQLANGQPIQDVAAQLGHSNINTTASKYNHPDVASLRRSYDRARAGRRPRGAAELMPEDAGQEEGQT